MLHLHVSKKRQCGILNRHTMTCPSCNKEATTFWRQSFTRQGVTYYKSMLGYFKCKECGALLKVTMFKKQLWIFFTSASIVLLVFVLNYKAYILKYGFDIIAALWIGIVAALVSVFTFGIWKYSCAEKVQWSFNSFYPIQERLFYVWNAISVQNVKEYCFANSTSAS